MKARTLTHSCIIIRLVGCMHGLINPMSNKHLIAYIRRRGYRSRNKDPRPLLTTSLQYSFASDSVAHALGEIPYGTQ